jgi:hypothetical protein
MVGCRNVFRQADHENGLDGGDLERWAYAPRRAGRGMESIGPLERAVAPYCVEGNRRGRPGRRSCRPDVHFATWRWRKDGTAARHTLLAGLPSPESTGCWSGDLEVGGAGGRNAPANSASG